MHHLKTTNMKFIIIFCLRINNLPQIVNREVNQ